MSVGKARRFQQELEEAEERADQAENTVMTLRTRSTRSMSVSRYAGSIRAASIGRYDAKTELGFHLEKERKNPSR